MSCSCNVFVLTWLLCVSDLLLDQLFLPRANDGSTPRACLTLWTYTLALWGILSVAAPHLILHCLHRPVLISITISSILRWVRHGSYYQRANAGIPLHSTPQCTLKYLIACSSRFSSHSQRIQTDLAVTIQKRGVL